MNRIILRNEHFEVACCEHSGSVVRISHPDDGTGMNWVAASDESPWHIDGADWGLGYASRRYRRMWRWQRAAGIERDKLSMTARYELGEIAVRVTRRLEADGLDEEYELTNLTPREISLDTLGVYAPFNDNYPSAEVCVTRRCSAHVWCGDEVSWVCAMRMGGERHGPHLGLALREGYLLGYGIEHRDTRSSSNIRGDIVLLVDDAEADGFPSGTEAVDRDAVAGVRGEALHHRPVKLAAGGTFRLCWRLFWHGGWEDFRRRLGEMGVPWTQARRYTVNVGEPIEVTAAGARIQSVAVGGSAGTVRDDGALATVPAERDGMHVVDLVLPGGRRTFVNVLAVRPLEELVAARVRFIVEHQQINDGADPDDGAYVPYDNDARRQVRSAVADRNAGRERLGMGVLLALYLQGAGGDAIRRSIERYAAFVRRRLQAPDGQVFDAPGRPDRRRLYDYPWVSRLWLELHRLWGRREHLEWCVDTMRAYYQAGGERFYALCIPVTDALAALRGAGLRDTERELLESFRAHAARVMATGLRYPSHEVNFEQSIVSPACWLLLELAGWTGERQYLDAAREHLECLETFGGLQPDARLNDIPIRHWDGYWFGKLRLWGDTMPHYWSTLTAMAFARYARLTGEQVYASRAEAILRANLASFGAGGAATCALTYPISIDGRPGRCADPYANDQDWALVHCLLVARDRRTVDRQGRGFGGPISKREGL